jgi:uncharacterized membrane protein YfcA
VAIGVTRRWGQQSFTDDDLLLVAIMGVASIVGASIGVLSREHMPVRPLKIVVCLYLFIAGGWMLYESLAHIEMAWLSPAGAARWILAAIIGFGIALVSGVLGVAGGEMRIPALLYLFGLSVVEAGTLSLAVSVPTVASGAIADHRLGGIPNSVVRVAIVMGLASALGVIVGAALVPYADRHTIKAVLGVVLLLATVRMTVGTSGEPE